MPPTPVESRSGSPVNTPSPSRLGTPDRYDFDDMGAPIRVGGRKSKLAVIQSRMIADKLRDVHPGLTFPVLALSTLGDNVQNRPLYSFGGKALWTKELEVLLLNKVPNYDQLDIIVHSLKDMPTTLPDGCALGAIPERHDPRDALCMKQNTSWKTLEDLLQVLSSERLLFVVKPSCADSIRISSLRALEARFKPAWTNATILSSPIKLLCLRRPV